MARMIEVGGRWHLFLHIPRTGGTWVEAAIDEIGIPRRRMTRLPSWIPKKHALLSHYLPADLASMESSFAFVRHPVAYYESVWKWLDRSPKGLRMRKSWTWHPFLPASRQFEECRGGDFNDWVFLMLQKEPMWVTRLVRSYVGPEGGEFCSFIGRAESLEDDFLSAIRSFGFPIGEDDVSRVRFLGPRNGIPMQVEWSKDLKEKVLESERIVIRRFYGRETVGRRFYAGMAEKEAEGLAAGGRS